MRREGRREGPLTGRVVRVALVLLLAFALGPSAARANHSRTELVSVGPGGANVTGSAFAGASEDGMKAFFETGDGLVPEDTDGVCPRIDYEGEIYYSGCVDVYERDVDAGTTKLVSIGPEGGSGHFDASFQGSSKDGAHLFFETREPLTGDDTDGGCDDPYDFSTVLTSCTDVYERAGDTTRRISTGPAGGNGPYDAEFGGTSTDGARVFFQTREPIFATDLDGRTDVYERTGDETTLISTGPGERDEPEFGAGFQGVSDDGTHVFFSSREPFVPEDTDSCVPAFIDGPCPDVYERTGGTTSLVSTGPGGNQDHFGAKFRANTPDGKHVFFETAEPLVPEDTDSGCPPSDGLGEVNCVDVYDRSEGTTKLISTGPKQNAAGTGTGDAAQLNGFSRDGTRVVFFTRDQLVDADTNTAQDAYLREGGVTTLLAAGGGDRGTYFSGGSEDLETIYVGAFAPLLPDDTDGGYFDLYKRHADGSLERATLGPLGGNGRENAFHGGVSDDGRRLFFETRERLVPEDLSPGTGLPSLDIYERFDGETTLISKGPTGQSAGFSVTLSNGVKANGRRYFFEAQGPLVQEDQDNNYDIYVAIAANEPPRCANASASPAELAPGDHKLRAVRLSGVTDADGDPVSVEITGVTQDEPVGAGPDAERTSTEGEVLLRAERDGSGDGRVYTIAFRASDGQGGTCSGHVTVGVRRGSKPAAGLSPGGFDSFGS
jgi:hypothetical protein